jgi:hypothetical protein
MKRQGRPPLSKKLKKVNFGFTSYPALRTKLKKIKGDRSPFISAILTAIPPEMIDAYNKNAEGFLENASNCTIALAEKHGKYL